MMLGGAEEDLDPSTGSGSEEAGIRAVPGARRVARHHWHPPGVKSGAAVPHARGAQVAALEKRKGRGKPGPGHQ
jgi:hypothetical protein